VATADITVFKLIERMLGRPLENMFPAKGAVLDDQPALKVVDLWADGLAEPTSIAVRPGEILGLAGQLGGGSSALLAAIAGANAHRGGSVTVDGRMFSPEKPYQAKQHGVAYCSSDRKADGLFLGLPVQMNLTAPALGEVSHFGWLSASLEKKSALKIARDMTISEERLKSPVSNLSGGNQQKVALGKWMSIFPKVLLVDEPTRGVDVGARAEIYARIRGMAARGVAVVIASTDIQEIAHLPDTVTTFFRGRTISTFNADGDQSARILKEITHPHSES
jgi:ABC-type sugar transport system ATPase subunit